jgi:hypothetical protein
MKKHIPRRLTRRQPPSAGTWSENTPIATGGDAQAARIALIVKKY